MSDKPQVNVDCANGCGCAAIIIAIAIVCNFTQVLDLIAKFAGK